jgi:tetratricopeptide (TPR) repeat protein
MPAVSATDVAKGLQLRGKTAEAEILYRELLAKEPDNLTALEGLGVLAFQQGRNEEAAACFARGVALAPDSDRFHANLGEALRGMKRFDQALLHLRKAAAIDPNAVQAWNSLGLLASDLGRNSAALHAFREAIRLRPRFVHAYINLANTYLARGLPMKAAEELRAAILIEPSNPLALSNLGRVLSAMDDPDLLAEAESVCRRALALAPRMTALSSTLAKILIRQGRTDEASGVEDRALRSGAPAPPRPESTERAAGQAEVAADGSTRTASPTIKSRAHALHSQGLAHQTEGRLLEAEACLREALLLNPDLAASWSAIAEIEADRGQFDKSNHSARSALAICPDLAEAHLRLATNADGDLAQEDVKAIEQALLSQSISNDDRALLHFAMAAVMNRRELYFQAAEHYDSANLHQSAGKLARGLAYDPFDHSRFIDAMIGSYTPEFLAQRLDWGLHDPRPVFVVGFPRSGTTLTEQILASHRQIYGAGELNDIFSISRSLHEVIGIPWTSPLETVHLLQPGSAKSAARRYLNRLDALAPPTAARVVDKMPDNLNHLGLIALHLPDARAIMCRRDPRDIALSCWHTGFRACPWNNDWDHIARRLADYQRMLGHWKKQWPLATLELPYEELVADLESHARRLIDFLGLDWDPACLEFHSNRRVVRTPSRVQVRQPVHSRSAGRWRLYEASLKPMFRAFERHGVELVDDN